MPRKSLTKVVYKPDTQSTDEFTVIVNLEEYKKWKEGDTTISLTEVVDLALTLFIIFFQHHVGLEPGYALPAFSVFFSNQGTQGILGKASNQQLDSVFGTHKDVDVVEQLLRKGKEQNADGISSGVGATNVARGGFTVDTRGKTSNIP